MDALPTGVSGRHLGGERGASFEMRAAVDREPGKIILTAIRQGAGGIEPRVELQKVLYPAVGTGEKLHTADPGILESLYQGHTVMPQHWGRRHGHPLDLVPCSVGAVGAQHVVLKICHYLALHRGEVAAGTRAGDVSLHEEKVVAWRPGCKRLPCLLRGVAEHHFLPEEEAQ